MLSFFKSKRDPSVLPLEADIHSHLLPGIDDGVDSYEEAIAILTQFEKLGYKIAITTPHIMQEFYPNNKEIITEKLRGLQQAANEANLNIHISAAAEYYLDETLIETLATPEKLMLFGGNFLLFETGYMNEPAYLMDAIFQIKAAGFQPIMAHPERYAYLQQKPELIKKLKKAQVLFQVNINALTGYYSKSARKIAEYLIDEKFVNFLGTDCHNQRHVMNLQKACQTKYFAKALSLDLLNYHLKVPAQ